MIFRDLHQLFSPGVLAEMMTGTVNGVEVTEQTLLIGGIALEIPIAMVILSRLLPYRASRWANVVVPVATIPLFLLSPPTDPDDTFFMTVEVTTLVLIVWFTWRWPAREA